ncbi:MAG TPA: ATP-binding protein [Candidatus Acidoferrales bacterium]|nr:ATP-binding protein [Candidatus Acidoferrales bacterium]
MAKDATSERIEALANDLRKIPVFSDLTADQLGWLASKSEEIRLAPGEIFVRPGDPAVWLAVILEGEVQLQRAGDPGGPLFTAATGQVTGYLPYSRLTQFAGTGRAVLPTRLVRLHRDNFPEMLQRIPEIGQRLVAIMADRIRETAKIETQRDKLMALGKLSAGLAHELNNPAAAAQRAAGSLREALETVRDASIRLARHALSPEQRETILRFEREAQQDTASTPVDPLAQSDREERITTWLEARQIPDSWKIAPVLADVGAEVPTLEDLAAKVGEKVVSDALIRIVSLLTISRLIGEIENSAKRISDLVRAIKEYSYMDQAPLQEVDIHHGIENTLTILGHRLKQGVTVIRDYDPNLPRVCAYGGELNQIWTNLIDNAIDAMNGKGELRIRSKLSLDRVLVEIGDNGPGIPPEMQARIFDPFFTTKGVGQGTGLGLDTACRIARKHHGDIRVVSKPGDTRFQVDLPITQPKIPSSPE